jgi:IPT/TIG domain
VVSDDVDAQSLPTTRLSDPAVQALSSLISLQEITPDHGPISGGEKVLLVGYGFSEGQALLVQFGYGTTPVSAEWVNQHILRCKLPPSDSARRVAVTLHWRDRSDIIPNEGAVYFTYEGDIDKGLLVHIFYVLVW